MKSKTNVASLTLYVNRGIAPKYTETLDSSIPVINQRCIRDFQVNMDLSRLNALNERKVNEEKVLKKYDVLVNSTGVGTLGRVAQFYGKSGSATVDSHVTIVRPNPGVIDPIYFGYLIKSKQSLIESFAAGTTGQTELARDSVKNMILEFVSDIEEQKKIASILKALEDKIQLNEQINQTLEEMAQALFKSWFVDFEPTKAKIAALEAGGNEEDANLAAMQAISGKTLAELATLKTQNPENYQQLYTTAQHFPAAMQESGLGEIPEGWDISTIESEYKVVMGQSPKGDTYNEEKQGTLFYQGRAEFGWRFPSPRLYTTDPKRMANKGDTLMSVRAPVGDLNIALEDCCIGRGLSALRHKSGCATFTYYQIQHLKKYLDNFNSEGTVFGSINQKDLKNILVIKSSKEAISAFSSVAAQFDELIRAKSVESLHLSSLRDALLPKLLSGELSVEELEVAPS